jgi:hypothetical protein
VTFAELYAAVRDQGGFDTGSTGETLTDIKAWVNEAYTRLVVGAKWRKAQVELFVTVADQAEYPLPATVVEVVEGILVGTEPWSAVGQETLWRLKNGNATADGGVWAEDFSSTGAVQIELYPAPDEAGVSVQALATLAPAALAADGDTPIIPADMHGDIIDGAIGIGYDRLENRPDLAEPKLAKLERNVEKLRRRANARLYSGPVEAQVSGYHF